MEQFLKLGSAAERMIAEHQESHDPQLRHRIHQLSSVLARRRRRLTFIEAISHEHMPLWDGILQINSLYDPQCNLAKVGQTAAEISDTLAEEHVTTPRVAAVFREHEFALPEEDTLDVDLYLIERVMETRYGSPVLLCSLAQHVSGLAGWSLTIVLYAGRFCLIDQNNLLLDPAEGWRISKLRAADRIHPASRKDVLIGVLAQLFLVALVEGQLRELYHFGDLLTALNGETVDSLPSPLGEDA
jgi:hypothetical protein